MLDAKKLTMSSQEFHSAKGNIVESIGGLTGSTDWQRSGQEEHARGEAEVNAAKAKGQSPGYCLLSHWCSYVEIGVIGYAEGGMDRIEGKKDSVVGAITGDKQQQMSGNAQSESGKAKQDFNRNF
jgi:uncharacterized protein YjbJ (UPF0337 family)